ncbi:amino acid permease [Achromobacter sp. Root83]|uniref:amino acid permease n=1 Tax=Achromobacter sp. Root83 TaxID=1736602 RepID=UPI0009EA12B9|nr:amino acid permease [Achromobacter sp. Root83]
MNEIDHIQRRESGLPAVLRPAQMSMVAIGAVLSYGLITGGGYSVFVAGPWAIAGYLAAAVLALLFSRCLAEMSAAHPTPGAFGAYAEQYLGGSAGFVVRISFYVAVVLIIGTEVPLLSYAFKTLAPRVPEDAVVVVALACLAFINARGARWFARVEFALSAFKLSALLIFVGLAAYYALAAGSSAAPPAAAASADGHGWADVFPAVWKVFILATLGYIGLESLSVAAAETAAPAAAIRRQMRLTAWAIAGVSLAVVGVSAALAYRGVSHIGMPPFFLVLRLTGLPWMGFVFQAIVAVTVLSVLNSLLYCASRMLFSLARAGQAPRRLGEIHAGSPALAVVATALLAGAVYAAYRWQPLLAGTGATAIASAGLMTVWLSVFAACARFRQRRGAGTRAWDAGAGALALLAIAASTWAIEIFHYTLRIGAPSVAALWLLHRLSRLLRQRKRGKPRAAVQVST